MRKDEILPPIREDIYIDVIEQDSQRYIVLTDPNGFCDAPLAFPADLLALIQMLDGKYTVQDLSDALKKETGEEQDITPLLDFVTQLDFLNFLESSRFTKLKNDIKDSTVRPPICAGYSYSEKPSELEKELLQFFSTAGSNNIKPNAKAIIVPHIDFKIGKDVHEVYSAGYEAIRESDAELFVIFGTAHKRCSDVIMLSEKDFYTPLGIVNTNKDIINRLRTKLSFPLTIDEISHWFEHSIEFQAVLLKYFFKNKNFTILPVLVGTYFEQIENNIQPGDNQRLSEFLTKLKDVIEETGLKTVYIASADMAHIGKKFGDEFEAEPILELLRNEDMSLIESLGNCNHREFFEKIASVGDERRICGLPPIYAMLQIAEPSEGIFLKYNQWNEKERGSAVSFASLAYY